MDRNEKKNPIPEDKSKDEKAAELTEEELAQVSGGLDFPSYNLRCTCPDCLINSNTYFSGGISGDENGMPCPVCNNGTWVVTKTK